MADAGTIVDGKYELLGTLGAGGFATVYRARQIGFDRVVALKVLDAPDLDESLVKRFEREAKILQEFQTKFIPAIYGYGLWDGRPYMAMELVSGVSLFDLLAREEKISFDRLKPVVTAVAQGLQYAHSKEVVHRDLSPANIILVNQQGMPDARIIDFGLATFTQYDLRNRQKLTEAGFTVGSFQYMSPEQCLAEPADGRSDIYALGCIIYRALTGRPPFDAENPVFLLKMHVNDPFPSLASEFGEGVQALLDKATAKEPNKRYQTADEFLQDWKKLQTGRPARGVRARIPAPSLGLIAMAMTVIVGVAFLPKTAKVDSDATDSENAAELVEEAQTLFESRYKGAAVKDIQAKHLALSERAFRVERAKPQLSPMNLETLYKNLSWAYRQHGNHNKALRYGKAAVELDISRSAPCTTAINIYQPAMYDAPPEGKHEFIEVMNKILDHQPPYNSEVKVAARIGIAQALMRLGEPEEARKIFPKGEEIPQALSKNWWSAKGYWQQNFADYPGPKLGE